VDTLFKNFAYIKKNHTCSLLKTAPYTRKYHFSDTAQNTGHTKKRPGQHGAARDRPGTGNNARQFKIGGGKKGVLLDWREKEEEEWLVQYIKLST
jgi:hypothetical protein